MSREDNKSLCCDAQLNDVDCDCDDGVRYDDEGQECEECDGSGYLTMQECEECGEIEG